MKATFVYDPTLKILDKYYARDGLLESVLTNGQLFKRLWRMRQRPWSKYRWHSVVLALVLPSCLGQTERTEPVEVVHILCSPGPACPDGWHCAVLQGGAAPNECRPSCETNADCNDGFGCSSAIGWFPDGSVETLACERWESKGY